MVLPKAKLMRSDFCVLWSTLLPEHSPDFSISPKPPSWWCPGVPSPVSLGKWQWGDAWGSMGAGRCLYADRSCLLKSYNCLFLSKVIIFRLSSPNSCQLWQKLWKYNIVGIYASSPDWIETNPTVSKLRVGEERGRWRDGQHKSSASFWPKKK